MAVDFWEMAPWEQLPYCAAPKQTNFTGPMTNEQICAANNQRYLLFIAIPQGGATAFISTDPNNLTNFGTPLTVNSPLLILSSSLHSIAPTFAWFCTVNGNVSVLEFIANDWPKDGVSHMAAIEHPPPEKSPTVLTARPGVGDSQGVSSYWKTLMSKLRGGG